MKKFFDRLITGFFVFVFGIAWFCTKYYVKPKPFRVIAYDVFGNETHLDIRKEFQNINVAISFIKEYQKNFPHLNFSIQKDFSEMHRKLAVIRIFQQNHK